MIKLIFLRDAIWYNYKNNFKFKKDYIVYGNKKIDGIYEIIVDDAGRYYYVSFSEFYVMPFAEYRMKRINEIFQD